MARFIMAWNRRYSIMSYARFSLWIVPVVALCIEIVLKRLSERLGGWMVQQGFYDLKTGFLALSPAEAHAYLDRLFTLASSPDSQGLGGVSYTQLHDRPRRTED